MSQGFTDRQTVAAVLAMLVRSRSVATGSSKTSRTGLQASVPVNERPGVRRGLDALIELGILAMSGEDIGFTSKGKIFLAHVQSQRGETPTAYEHDERNPRILSAMLDAIDADERLTPDGSLDSVRTLPARLEGYRETRTSRFSKTWFVLAGLIVAAAAYMLLR